MQSYVQIYTVCSFEKTNARILIYSLNPTCRHSFFQKCSWHYHLQRDTKPNLWPLQVGNSSKTYASSQSILSMTWAVAFSNSSPLIFFYVTSPKPRIYSQITTLVNLKTFSLYKSILAIEREKSKPFTFNYERFQLMLVLENCQKRLLLCGFLYSTRSYKMRIWGPQTGFFW